MNVNINPSLSALGNLLAAIVDSNPAFAVITEPELGVVSVSGVTADADGRNTVVVVNATGYADTQSFTYARRSLTDNVVAPAPTSLALKGTEKAADVLAAVAALLNLVPSELTLNASWINTDGSITVPTPAADGSVTTGLSVTSNTASLLYIDGSGASLTVNFPSVPVVQPVSINTLVVNSALNGFAPAAAPAAPVEPVAPAAPATDGQSSVTPAAGTTTTPAADGTTTQPVAGTTPAANTDGQASGSTPTSTPVAPASDAPTTSGTAATDGQPAAPAAPATGADATPASTN